MSEGWKSRHDLKIVPDWDVVDGEEDAWFEAAWNDYRTQLESKKT